MVTIDRDRSSKRIERDIETLASSDYTSSGLAICRYAYSAEYRATLDYFGKELDRLSFAVAEDPVGNFVARNRPTGKPVFGVGSHCDSNRNGGKYDGTLGVVTALEICRLNCELDLGLPLQLVSFLEEEGSGFGQMLLGSRVASQRISEQELRDVTAIDDGRSFWEHAEAAGHEPSRWRECAHILENLTGWIELHIEQGRVLQDTSNRIGVVNAIAGYTHGDIVIEGRADHAGATPMDFRVDAGLVGAETMIELERLARKAGKGTVGTVGEFELEPALINVIPGRARLSMDVRGVDDAAVAGVVRDTVGLAEKAAQRRGATAEFVKRQSLPATPMDVEIVAALEVAAAATGEPTITMPSGAAHDTMCVADRVPAAMVFVPCKDGISHSPREDASPADAALAAEIIINAIVALTSQPMDEREEAENVRPD